MRNSCEKSIPVANTSKKERNKLFFTLKIGWLSKLGNYSEKSYDNPYFLPADAANQTYPKSIAFDHYD
jgi:hypothetical protein